MGLIVLEACAVCVCVCQRRVANMPVCVMQGAERDHWARAVLLQ